jgi:hypothetical protein
MGPDVWKLVRDGSGKVATHAILAAAVKHSPLLRAADLIGQLGDPHYLKKSNALYYEFEEIGLNKQLGYDSPSDLVDKYPQFYWNRVAPHIQAGIRYLNVTSNGRRRIAGLYSNVFRAEHELRHAGPQA